MVTEIVVGILAFAGGATFGALVRQPEINKLKEQVKTLEIELSNMHDTVEDLVNDIELIRLAQDIKDNNELFEAAKRKMEGASETDLGTLIYSYAFKEYLEIKVKFLIERKDISEEESIFLDSYTLFMQSRVEPDKQLDIKKFLKEYITDKYNDEISSKEFPDLRSIVATLDCKLEEYKKAEEEKQEKIKYNKVISDLEKLFLIDSEQTRIMYSIQLRMIQYDIDNSPLKTDNDYQVQQHKIAWRDQWKQEILNNVCDDKYRTAYFIKDDDFLYSELNKCLIRCKSYNWIYLVALECALFKPYSKFSKNDKNIWKGLKVKSDYLCDVFCKKQHKVSNDDIKIYRSTYKKNLSKLDKNFEKAIITATTIAIASLATGGAASVLAPEIAVAIVGESFLLSGAALTNASLALIGGGSLAVGGMGMAGGTAIITGGGVLVGALSSGMSATAACILSVNGLGIHSSALLLTFCDVVLKKQKNFDIVAKHIIDALKENVENCEKIKNEIKTQKEKDKEDKEILKQINENLKYINRCISILEKEKDKFTKKLT